MAEVITYFKCECGDEHGITLEELKDVISAIGIPYGGDNDDCYADVRVSFDYTCKNCGRNFESLLYETLYGCKRSS